MKTLLEWMHERDIGELSRGAGLETQYDVDLINAQLSDWVTRLNGLVYEVPKKERKNLVEKIIKDIRKTILEG